MIQRDLVRVQYHYEISANKAFDLCSVVSVAVRFCLLPNFHGLKVWDTIRMCSKKDMKGEDGTSDEGMCAMRPIVL